MTAIDALRKFANGALISKKARRYVALLETKKGVEKIIDELCHQFESAINPKLTTTLDNIPLKSPCFIFKGPNDHGAECDTMETAYAKMSQDDSWLIISQDGLSGIYRPEGKWDHEKAVKIK